MAEKHWSVCAECGIAGSDINYEFLKSLSTKEFKKFGSSLYGVVKMYAKEFRRRNG
jgi:hypothetical protein